MSSTHFVKNRRKLSEKFRLCKTVESICDGSLVFNLDETCKKYVSMLLKTQDQYLSSSGKELKSRLLYVKNFYSQLETKNVLVNQSSDFAKTKFLPFYEKHGPKV